MKINIKKIYDKNITVKYFGDNQDDFKKDFSPKEQEIWHFTLELLKNYFPMDTYDDKTDSKFLNDYLDLYLCGDNIVKFTIDEWFSYLKSKE